MTLRKLQKFFRNDMERTPLNLSLVILLIATAKILLTASRIEKAICDSLSAILRLEGMGLLLLLVTLLSIIATATIKRHACNPRTGRTASARIRR